MTDKLKSKRREPIQIDAAVEDATRSIRRESARRAVLATARGVRNSCRRCNHGVEQCRAFVDLADSLAELEAAEAAR